MTDLDYLIIMRRLAEKKTMPCDMEPYAFWTGEPTGWVFAVSCPSEIKKRLEGTSPRVVV